MPRIVLVARRADELQAIVAALANENSQADFLAGDITDPAVRSSAVARCQERFGGLDLLVNNAGVGALGRFDGAALTGCAKSWRSTSSRPRN